MRDLVFVSATTISREQNGKEMNNYYEILEVSPNASLDVIRGAYKILLHRYNLAHDSEDQSEIQKLNHLNLAYDVLSDPDKREVYDLEFKKVKHEMNEPVWSHQTGHLALADTPSSYEDAPALLRNPKHANAHKPKLSAFLNRLKWNRWGWSLSILAVAVVLLSMVRPDPEKAMQGQLAVQTHVEKKELDNAFVNTGTERSYTPVASDKAEQNEVNNPAKGSGSSSKTGHSR